MATFVRPEVVRANLADGNSRAVAGVRLASLFWRPCPYCAEPMTDHGGPGFPTKEHVRPKSRGGGNGAGNILIVCRACNGDKDSMTLREFYEALALAGDRRAGIVRALAVHRGASVDDDAPARVTAVPGQRRGPYRIPRPLSRFHTIAIYLKERRERTPCQSERTTKQ